MRITPLNLSKSLKLIKSINFQNSKTEREPNIKTPRNLNPSIKRKKYPSKCLRNEK